MVSSYRERIMQSRRTAPSPSAPAPPPCGQPSECHAMFEVIASGLDDLKEESTATRGAIAELAERMSAQETQTKNLWHQVRSVEESVRSVPVNIVSAIERHEDTCGGREYARAKLASTTTKSDVPLAVLRGDDVTQNIRIGGGGAAESPLAGLPWHKIALYVGGGIGGAIAGAAYLLAQLGVFGK